MIATINNIPVYDALISDDECGMMRISLVDDPAVMSDFLSFDKDRKMELYAIQDASRHLIRGCVMRADFPIYRCDNYRGEFYIIYKPEEIRRMAEKYLVEGRQNMVNIMHQEGSDVEGVQMVQYFIKGDGVSVDGFDDVADGSLFAEFHVTNPEIWAQIQEGTFKGFSLEGVFELAPDEQQDDVTSIAEGLAGAFRRLFKSKNMNKTKVTRAIERLARVLANEVFTNVTTDRGILVVDGDEEIKVGDAVFIEDEEGNRTPAEDGEYTTADNKVIVVAEGKVAEIKDAEVEPQAPEAPAPEAEAPQAESFLDVETDKATLIIEGEEIAVGAAVLVANPEGEEAIPAPDGEYKLEDGRILVIADGVIAEIKEAEEPEAPAEPEPEADAEAEELRKENAELKAKIAELTAQVEKMSKAPLANPAHKEFEGSSAVVKTGDKGLDRLARIANAR